LKKCVIKECDSGTNTVLCRSCYCKLMDFDMTNAIFWEMKEMIEANTSSSDAKTVNGNRGG